MADKLAGRVRLAETVAGLERLEREISAWVERRRAHDRLGQYATPLATLELTLTGAVRALREEAGTLPADQPVGERFAAARVLDRRATLVREVLTWFRAKFDQRDDAEVAGVLAAADEVVWSCWKEAFDSAALGGDAVAERGPAPLPYLDPRGGAEAFVRDQPPPGLGASEADQALGRFLVRLPVPVVRLPVGCLDTPWWLGLLAHEVGHHLQYDLLPELALVAEVGEVVAGAVNGDPLEAARWRGWSRELFADACALLALGPAAIGVTLQVELGGEATLLDGGRGRYPAPVVRLAFLAELARQLRLSPQDPLGGLDPALLTAPHAGGEADGTTDSEPGIEPDDTKDGDPLAARRERARADLERVPTVAAALLQAPLGGLGPLPRLFRFKAADHGALGRIAGWAEALEHGDARPEPTLRAAREAAAGALLVWQRLAATADDAQRAEALGRLAGGLPPLLAGCREAATRAGEDARAPQDRGGELAALLREAIPDATAAMDGDADLDAGARVS